MKLEQPSRPGVTAKTVYETADGMHFDNRIEAQRHHAFLAVRDEMLKSGAYGELTVSQIEEAEFASWIKIYEEAMK